LVRHQLFREIDVEAERDLAEGNSRQSADANKGNPGSPNHPQASLPAHNQTENIGDNSVRALTGLRHVAHNRVALVGFEGKGKEAE